MKRTKVRDLSIVFFVGLFLLTKEILFIWLLVFFIVAMSTSYGNPAKKNKRKYLSDADNRGIKIPPSQAIHQRLETVYKKFADSTKRQPELSDSFEDLVEGLWDNLALADRLSDWRGLLDDVIDKWPAQRKDVRKSLESKIKKVQKLSDQWSEARNEVYGKS